MWEALVVGGLVAAFVAVTGIAALAVYRLWGAGADASGAEQQDV